MFESCVCVNPDEVCEILSSRTLKANKEHRCGECRCVIRPGESYRAENTVFEKEFTVYKTCLTCFRIRESLFSCGHYWGQVWEAIHETYCGWEDDECICPDRP